MRSDRPGPYSLDTLRSSPRLEIYERDPLAIKKRAIQFFQKETGRTLYEGQVEMYLIETLAYALSVAAEEAQAVAEQYLVAYADEQGLEALGPNRSTERLPAARASVLLRFTLNEPRGVSVVVPVETRVRSEMADIVFMTQTEAVIAPGAVSVDVPALADVMGARANTIAAGAVTVMLDPIAGVSVTNIAAPDDGADREDADAYRLRLANAFERISKAGPEDGYREAVMGVSSAIVDCAVVRPQPCYIDIYALTETGTAGDALKGLIAATLDPETARPMGDEVTLRDCAPIAARAVVTIRVRSGAAVVEPLALAALLKVKARWRNRLGATIAPSDLVEAVKHIAGVVDVQVDGLEYRQLAQHEYMDDLPIDLIMALVS